MSAARPGDPVHLLTLRQGNLCNAPSGAPGGSRGTTDPAEATCDACFNASLRALVRDMLQAFPDTADEQEWRDRAGALRVRDPGGKPYRAYTEEDM